MDAGFFRGTSVDQDARFSNKEKKLIESMQFPPEFNKKVDMKKVRLDMIQPWIAQKVTDLLGTEDEILIQMIYGHLEPSEEDLCPKKLQVNLTPFLERNTAGFVKELWDLLLSAQENIGGIPSVILEQKKQELLRLKEQNERAQQHLQAAQQHRQNGHNREHQHPASTNGVAHNNNNPSSGEMNYGLNLRSVRPEISQETNVDRRKDLRRDVKEELTISENNGKEQRRRSRSRDRHASRHRSSRRSSRSRSRDRDRRHHHSSRRHRSRSSSPSRRSSRSSTSSSSRSHHSHHHHHSSSSSSSRRREERDTGRNLDLNVKRENEGEGEDRSFEDSHSPSNRRSVAIGGDKAERKEDLSDLRQHVLDSIPKA